MSFNWLQHVAEHLYVPNKKKDLCKMPNTSGNSIWLWHMMSLHNLTSGVYYRLLYFSITTVLLIYKIYSVLNEINTITASINRQYFTCKL